MTKPITDEEYRAAKRIVWLYEAQGEKLFEQYLPDDSELPAEHEPRCQKVRLGEIHPCTCERAMVRRRLQVANGGKALDRRFLATLGSTEQYAWYEAAKTTDPLIGNPYKSSDRK